MRIALHPTKNCSITIEQFRKEIGPRDLLSKVDIRPRPRCPFCFQPLNDVGGKSARTRGHFAHFPNRDPCPSKAIFGRAFYNLAPVDPDPQRAQFLKDSFWLVWEQQFGRLEELVTFLSKDEFLALVREANRLRVWEYRGLECWEIPYVFALMSDFPASNSCQKDGQPQRAYRYRFWYGPSVQSIGDLWIRGQVDPILLRGKFSPAKHKDVVPGQESMVWCDAIERTRDFMVDFKKYGELPNALFEEIDAELRELLGY